MALRDGFLLLQFTIYLVLATILVSICIHWYLSVSVTNRTIVERYNIVTNGYLAHDLLVRDIRKAPGDKGLWKKIDHSAIIWHAKEKDIGWHFQDNQLTRIEGTYHQKTDSWAPKSSSLVASKITNMNFDVTTDVEKVVSVSFSIQLDTSTSNGAIKSTVFIRRAELT